MSSRAIAVRLSEISAGTRCHGVTSWMHTGTTAGADVLTQDFIMANVEINFATSKRNATLSPQVKQRAQICKFSDIEPDARNIDSLLCISGLFSSCKCQSGKIEENNQREHGTSRTVCCGTKHCGIMHKLASADKSPLPAQCYSVERSLSIVTAG